MAFGRDCTIGIAVPLLVLVILWLCLLFFSFALFAPPNATVTTALFICALVAADAIYMTLELNRPFRGIIRISKWTDERVAPVHR